MTRYVFVTGGVVSSLGKGIAAAGLAALLQARGYSVRLRKLDPYLNVDPGTMSPFQHGEVFVTDDGAETDLDLGHYERFTGVSCTKDDTVTSGRVYQDIITRERRGDYLGGTVQVVPHVTDEIKSCVLKGAEGTDFIIVEIGGTVGDIEALPFLEAIRQLKTELPRGAAINIHLTLLPYIAAAGELKTKPTQHSVKELRGLGIQPDVLLCRADRPIPEGERRKLALFCNVRQEDVVPALDVESIYDIPLAYGEAGLDARVLEAFGILDPKPAELGKWETVSRLIHTRKKKTRIALVGKYVASKDAYKSVNEALVHGGLANEVGVEIDWVDSDEIVNNPNRLASADGIIVPGGFGHRGVEGKIAAARYARHNGIPYLGICLGMQTAVIEAVRSNPGFEAAGSTEFGETAHPVVCLMEEWQERNGTISRKPGGDLGGSMRLGGQTARLRANSTLESAYGAAVINERHRHRYEVNSEYAPQLEKAGLVISAWSADGSLPEAVERKDGPFFVAVQYHPELKSRPFDPHPLFSAFMRAASEGR